MLTHRGWWFFIVTLALLFGAIVLKLGSLALVALTLLVWFLGSWLWFQVQRLGAQRWLHVERRLVRQGQAVDVLWAKNVVTVRAALGSRSRLPLGHVLAADRVPLLAVWKQGNVFAEGEVHHKTPLVIEYDIACPSAGRLRFDGLKVQLADPQGFFFAALFVRAPQHFRVLPPLTDDPEHLPVLKRHNLLPLLGTHRHLRPGSGSELLDLRDYLPGDPPKMIAWKASARRDRLMTKEFESEVPVRCTLLVDISSSVRVGPAGRNALARVVEIASAVVHANAEQRDLSGLYLLDEQAMRLALRPGRGRRHVLRLITALADAAELPPQVALAPLERLIPLAYGLAQDVYPEMLDRDVNRFPWWLPLWAPQPIYTIPQPGRTPRTWLGRSWLAFKRALRDSPLGLHRARGFRFVPARHRALRLRKKVAALLAVRYQLGPGGLGWLLEDDQACGHYVQRFLAEHQVAAPLPFYDAQGRYLFRAPAKIQLAARALLDGVLRGKENELFVLLVDLLDSEQALEPLLQATRVALARHHQVQVICPWPPGAPLPGKTPPPLGDAVGVQESVAQASAARLQASLLAVQQAFAPLGIAVIAAPQQQAVSLILSRMHKLRGWQRSVR